MSRIEEEYACDCLKHRGNGGADGVWDRRGELGPKDLQRLSPLSFGQSSTTLNSRASLFVYVL